jgi:hypothetical protein
LPSLTTLLRNPPGKGYWGRLTKKVRTTVWENRLKEEANSMSSLSHLIVNNCRIGQTHRVWRLEGQSSLEVSKAAVKAKLLVSRYPLHSCRVSGKSYGKQCPMCQDQNETVEHFLLSCPALATCREPIIKQICDKINNHELTDNLSVLTQLILDCSDLVTCNKLADDIEILSRKLCFNLHHKRSVLLGYGSQYTRVSRKPVTWL